ncbi:mono-functional DNA-alkylating methyl methanesulfonate N-term-domain-containing protein [Microdochium trichocladiopsis]|uniref:Mono-functional DNA-alkylating methyl methanesulfonate N-term-domain-containing protein n=1 Tax=Microdochium trichocladiopsis TaxID=1682393 RepID=A0A9P8Y6V5_9PEZI|nr:mono-functional DNA-alkylating methyl methanesulfonate N-term-domain-containing protein [Microdochium trichocladiopsis]KAH7031003.1 mono-functional DNA-alkylating methyl methanesulfonate N-term-domain-containing protein [Microdochium trichocladiopsis]
MSIQSSVFENGEWVTRAMTTAELIKQNGHSRRPGMGRQPLAEPPTCGLLTRTVVDSPVTRWILPVRLRSSRFNDVAFIGENYVQIFELDELNSQLRDIKRKRDFSAKIRNAAIIGPASRHPEDDGMNSDVFPKVENDADIDMTDRAAGQSVLPPQLLVLVLENGQVLFLFMTKGSSGQWVFETSYWSLPVSHNAPIPLHHLTVDPRSRYLCFGHTTTLFVICELETMETLRQRYSSGLPLDPVKKMHPRAISGSIGNISFLYPALDAESHVILLVIMIQRNSTKLAYYEWEHGHEELSEVFHVEKPGLKLHEEFRLPLMVIPLTVRSAFIIVTEGALATISGLLEGSLKYDTFDLDSQDPTDFHHGRSHPLCVAWTRPVREAQFHESQDVIYLVREDGIINFLEVGVDPGIETSLEMGEVDCNFDTAFACMYDRFGDVLLAGGESGPGAMWNIQPKAKLQPIRKFPNWAPMVDLTVMHATVPGERHHKSLGPTTRHYTGIRDGLTRPDRLFGCSGKGRSGVITEFRHGLEAQIGLEMNYPVVIRQCWIVSTTHIPVEDSILLLLALPDSTSVLQIQASADGGAYEMSEADVPWDLTARTLAFTEHKGSSIQVTTKSVTVASSDFRYRSSTSDLFGDVHTSIAHAFILENQIVLAVRSGSLQKVVALHTGDSGIAINGSFDVLDEITCLSMTRLRGTLVTLVATWHGRSVQLAVYPEADSGTAPVILPLQALMTDVLAGTDLNLCPCPIEPLTSMVPVPVSSENGSLCVTAGTRSGEVLTIHVQSGHHTVTVEKLGVTPVQVSCLSLADEPSMIMATNDEEPVWMTGFQLTKSGACFKRKHRVWPAAIGEPNFPAMSIGAVARVPPQSSNSRELMHLIMVSGSQIMYIDLHTRPRPLMRQFPTNGTPTKVRYDANCNALVTAVAREGRSILCLFDPETGVEISEPRTLVTAPDGKKQPRVCEQIDGLSTRAGQDSAVKIMCLDAWSIRHEHHTWPHLLLGCRTEPKEPGGDARGLLLVVKVEHVVSNVPVSPQRRVPIMRKFASKFAAPITAITSHDHGVFVAFGSTVEYMKIDPEVKKLKTVKSFDLPSPARSLHIRADKLHVVTSAHSLVVLDFSNDSLGREHMVLLHSDEMSRRSLDVIDVGLFLEHDRRQSIAMLSDMSCGVHGLWLASQEESPLVPLFQAETRASILKFGRANTRARWHTFQRPLKFGCLQSGKDNSEIVGISIDGALHHFTLINEHAWRLLRFIQNLAMAAPATGSYRSPPNGFDVHGPEPQSDKKVMMHVDGDVLQQCLDRRALEVLVSDQRHSTRLQQLLEKLVPTDSPDHHATASEAIVDFDLVYEVLEYYLCPIL